MEEDNFIADLDFSFAKCVCLLEDIKQVDDDTYMKTMEKINDWDWREIFINMSIDRNKAWLARL